MPHPSWTDVGFMLANWEVRPRHGTLLRRDIEASQPVRVEPRVMAVLTCLARHVGEVVTRDEFSTEVWGGRVVSDEALSRCISRLRQVLADDSREPRFIRTIARIGYTLVPTPQPLASGGAAAAMSLLQADAPVPVATGTVADPNNPEVRQMCSQLLGAVGHIDAALAQARLAQEIDPLAPVVADRIGDLNLWLGRDADAESDVALARELGLDELAYPETKILLKLHEHEDEAAADDLRALMGSLHRSDAWVGPAIDAYRHPEKRPATIALLDRAYAAGGISARIYFGVMVLLESPARALRGFAALRDRGGNDLEFLFSVDAAAVRRDLAFGEFVRKISIEAYWDRFGWPRACRREGAQIVCH